MLWHNKKKIVSQSLQKLIFSQINEKNANKKFFQTSHLGGKQWLTSHMFVYSL